LAIASFPTFAFARPDTPTSDVLPPGADELVRQHFPTPRGQTLTREEIGALYSILEQRDRQLTDKSLKKLLNNPVAWENRSSGRPLLSRIIKSLPKLATMPGVDQTVLAASRKNEPHFRGFGVELMAASALHDFRTEEGVAKLSRLGAMIKGADGVSRESDGAAFVGADGKERLVTVKSTSSVKAVGRAVQKASEQLALRNLKRDGSRMAGIMMIGYDKPEVLEKLKRKNWQIVADHTGEQLLVLALDQLTGKVTKVASKKTSPDAVPFTAAPKVPGKRNSKRREQSANKKKNKARVQPAPKSPR
jgi:hypothetical protein